MTELNCLLNMTQYPNASKVCRGRLLRGVREVARKVFATQTRGPEFKSLCYMPDMAVSVYNPSAGSTEAGKVDSLARE